MLKKYVLIYLCFSFISSWLLNINSNCEYIYSNYKLHNMTCSIIRFNEFDVKSKNLLQKSSSQLNQSLFKVLNTAVEKKYDKVKLCKYCYLDKLLTFTATGFNTFYSTLKINSLHNILILSSSFINISISQALDKLWFYQKAHSPS